MSGYASSKGALHIFSQTLRLEAAPLGIRVSEVLPISVATPFFGRSESAPGVTYRPKGIVQTPEHVARCVLACLDKNYAELCTHSPTAWGFALQAMAPNWTARLLSLLNRT
jgi:short-subunit dehydrogenase